MFAFGAHHRRLQIGEGRVPVALPQDEGDIIELQDVERCQIEYLIWKVDAA